jgi:hypothetical protein
MPAPLGAGAGKAGSEPHHHPDPTANLTSRLPDPPINDKPVRSHDLYVPPGMAPMAVHGSVEDIEGPRTGALGLEGMEGQAQHAGNAAVGRAHGRGRAGTVGSVMSGLMGQSRAPTVRPSAGAGAGAGQKKTWYG